MSWMPSAATVDRARKILKKGVFLNALDSTHWDRFDTEYVEVLATGKVDAVNVTVPWVEDDFRSAIRSYMRWERQFEAIGAARMVTALSVADIMRAKQEGKLAVIRGFQNSKPIEDDPSLADVFHKLGVRIMQLTYNRRNYVADGCAEPNDGGLSKYGVQYVKHLGELRFVIDLSHSGRRTALDAVSVSDVPPVMTHTNMRSLCSHFRCVADEVVKAIAERGGVVGITALSIFLRDDGIEKGSHISDFVAHVDHAVNVAGIDHVGIGFDVGYKRNDADTAQLVGTYPEFKFPPLERRYCEELNRADKAHNAIAVLFDHGYSDEDVAKLMGGNFLRVFLDVWGS